MHKHTEGYITTLTLVVVATASIILFGLAFLVANQYQLSQRQTALEQGQAIAEAGINYYRWHLAHAPNDYTDATNQAGPYVHDYKNAQATNIGKFSLEITPPNPGSTVSTIKSTGWMNDYPDIKRTISIQYGHHSLAQYALLYNKSVYIPSGFVVNGPMHSNGGIRMDGTNTSLVASSVESYTCTNKYGDCSPPALKPGVWGSGGDQGLWQYPVPPIDFGSITVDYNNMKSVAQTDGLYLSPSGTWGYHLIFNASGTLQVYKVTKANNFKGGKGNPGCEQLYGLIQTQTLIGTYQTADIPLIFIEDNAWVEGTVTSSLTITAAQFPIDTKDTAIWISNNLKYSIKDGSIQLGLISQQDIYIHRDVPNDFELDAALLAQSGRILRHNYSLGCAGNPATAVRNSFTFYGSLISAEETQWNWGSSTNSGFRTGTITFDSHLKDTPPPYFPTTGVYEVLTWY